MTTSIIRFDDKHILIVQIVMCTITLEDIALQLNLLVDGSVIAGSVIIPGKEDFCTTLLGKVPNSFEGGWIQMKWLETNFKKLPLHVTYIVKEQYARALILKLIGVETWAELRGTKHGPSYVGLLEQLERY
ncbi:hypothetical protein J1N35_043867 [Gossypium stocksii]|uniref:Uncharacterized protein n=1 Tax=Gossypium stocksii TaxID=47602 RepID=A0A9D3U827_9ROSI|nr:hypothetical protein J1N35_043867 [Gossypium stocksii]